MTPREASMKKLSFLAAVTAVLIAHSAKAQDWPNRQITMVAPFAAGGSTDAIARIVADGLSTQLHQPVIVENVGGAGGMTGANRVAKACPTATNSCWATSARMPRTRRSTRPRCTTP
jgi:tripartite-type tricarboxylate transporter receptor subunit TctC